MNKAYVCRLGKTTILIEIDGNVKRLEFDPDVVNSTGLIGCSYCTENAKEQEAIERHPRFRNGQMDGIWLYGESFAKPVEKVKAEPKEPVRVKRIQKEKEE